MCDASDLGFCRYVLANIPTMLRNGVSNEVEEYEWCDRRSLVIVRFTYVAQGAPVTKVSSVRVSFDVCCER